MVYSAQYNSFSADKKDFFLKSKTVRMVGLRAKDKNEDYAFLANNRLLIEQEFNQLFASLKNQSDDNKEFWLYCYYCCKMLHSYYSAYGKKDKADYYGAQCDKLEKRCRTNSLPEDEIRSLKQKIAADLGVLVSTPVHIAKLRDWAGFGNIYRLHATFCRLTVRESILLANELKWLDILEQKFGFRADVNGMVSTLNAPAPLFNVLSVGLFVARFIINAAMLLKHTFVPATDEEESLSIKKRFYQELYTRHWGMINEAVWGVTNLLTNYNTLFGITAPVASWLTASVLVFDVAWLFYRRHLVDKELDVKEAQYRSEKSNYQTLMNGASISLSEMKKYHKHCEMLDAQLDQLTVTRQTANATYLFYIGAAILLTSSFSASLLLATPAAVVVCYFAIVVGVAMYLSGDIYGSYKEKSIILNEAKKNNKDVVKLDELDKEKTLAWNQLIKTTVKNIFIPMFIVTAFAVCWQAALLVTALYIGYECLHGYFKGKPPTNNASLLPLAAADNDEGGEVACINKAF